MDNIRFGTRFIDWLLDKRKQEKNTGTYILVRGHSNAATISGFE
jgi:hypothetical protein